MNCETIRTPERTACGKPATYMVTWRDGVSYACTDCAIYLKQLGLEYKSPPRFDRIANSLKLPAAKQA